MGVFVGVGVGVWVLVGPGVGELVTVGVLVGSPVDVGVRVGIVPLVVSRRSSNTWSNVLERSVKLVTGFVHPVTSV
jgi:hypothetical protein